MQIINTEFQSLCATIFGDYYGQETYFYELQSLRFTMDA